ncbi:hypothetical protein [Gilvimarinus sp. DA14]|uniref:hypothetical protein n=1 Tax=Gilvimarinus sp. DA14 TaxID=2956798 RepID=UPI0020B8AD5B|nr:hypothetical protein [Gilvimarinus sp. DA14]UTF61699.1 hypothetical protein NHM04_07885 [Gilvimarinus sp. DA14]
MNKANLKRLMLMAVLGAALAGCSSTPSYGDLPETLSVRILPNSSKQFIYRVGLSPEMDRKANIRRGPTRAPDKRDYKKLKARTGYVVAATGYCRDGFLELDFRLSNYVQWLRGECREGASADDMQAYGDITSLPLDNLPEE